MYQFPLAEENWTEIAAGLREKKVTIGSDSYRLLEFSPSFQEPDWCMRGHRGFVIEGSIIVNIDGNPVTFAKGDVLSIPENVRHRHEKTIHQAVLFLMET